MEQSKIWNSWCERENKKDDQSMTVTRTYAKLPFHDLSPERFEDICLQIAYRMRSWTDLHHYGVQGQDGAIDIFGEFEEEGCLKKCVIQCKRVKTLTAEEVKKNIR